MSRISQAFLITMITIALTLSVAGHVPEIATGKVIEVPDAAKSYAWYGVLEDSDTAESYLLSVDVDSEIKLQISTPDAGESPELALLGPGIGNKDPLPEFVQIPEGFGSILIPVDQTPSASYEPFTPMVLYERAEYSISAPESGEYHAVVFGNIGRYVLATGYIEEFSIAEWVMVPIQVFSIRVWQGQPLVLVLLPILGIIAAGMYWFWKKKSSNLSAPGAWLLAIAGFAYIGSGVLVFAEMMVAGSVTGLVASMMVTVFFAAIPILLGVLIVKKAFLLTPPPSWRDRGLVILFGILGFIFWAGAIIGPILAIAAAFMLEKE
ncbi:MAG: hypothetical protein LUO81_00750 [Methanoregulaceae archaeon]|nr:hypothetical protein [Methanoregulaceae archaeon]